MFKERIGGGGGLGISQLGVGDSGILALGKSGELPHDIFLFYFIFPPSI
jgi:hypothetical protein